MFNSPRSYNEATLDIFLGNFPECYAGLCVNIMRASVLLVTSQKTVTDGWTPFCILITQTTLSQTYAHHPQARMPAPSPNHHI